MNRRARRLLPLLLLAGGLWPPAGFAAVPDTGLLHGRVTDAAGSPLPGLSVSLIGPRGVRSSISGKDGVFHFPALPPGEYEVSTAVGGSEVVRSVRVGPGTSVQLDLRLAAHAAGRVDVVAEALVLDRIPAGAAKSLRTETTSNLAFAGRNFQSIFGLFAGTNDGAYSLALGRQRPSTYGSQWQETAGFVDGVDTSNTRAGGGTRLFLPASALEEVSLHGPGYETRFGRSVGGVLNAVVKTGTNTLTGSFLSILQSERWRAQSQEVPLPRDPAIRGSVEASIGGPMVRDRAWFFLAASRNSSNEIDALADGNEVDASLRQRSVVLKLSAQPGSRHALALTAIDAPVSKTFWNSRAADRFAAGDYDLNESFVRLSWYTTPRPNLDLEADVATFRSEIIRRPLEVREIDPQASPASPLGNTGLYEDLSTRLRYNALSDPAGSGYNRFPRSQASVRLDWFRERHSIEAGLDLQWLSWRSLNRAADLYRGEGYDESLPGGFAVPISKRVFIPQESPTDSDGRVVSFYLQDLFTPGPRWTFRLGLRVDGQSQRNDVGEAVVRSTDWVPRLGATVDLSGRGRLLLEATLGRTTQAIPLNMAGEVLASLPNGLNSWTERGWNPATELYDLPGIFKPPPAPNSIQAFDPYYKDEVTIGLNWDPRPHLWTATARLIHWRLENLYWTTEQFNDAGIPFVAIRNETEGQRHYLGLELAIDRRAGRGLTWGANYTLSRVEGNMFPAGALGEDTLFEGRGGIEPETGRTDATSVNRYGPGNSDRTHNLNALFVRSWNPGRHTLELGGLLAFRSGMPWAPIAPVKLTHPESGLSIWSITYEEPRGSRRLPATHQLNLSASWSPPLGRRWSGKVGLEVANLTDEQQLVAVNPVTGAPPAGRVAYQRPRELRLLLGFDF